MTQNRPGATRVRTPRSGSRANAKSNSTISPNGRICCAVTRDRASIRRSLPATSAASWSTLTLGSDRPAPGRPVWHGPGRGRPGAEGGRRTCRAPVPPVRTTSRETRAAGRDLARGTRAPRRTRRPPRSSREPSSAALPRRRAPRGARRGAAGGGTAPARCRPRAAGAARPRADGAAPRRQRRQSDLSDAPRSIADRRPARGPRREPQVLAARSGRRNTPVSCPTSPTRRRCARRSTVRSDPSTSADPGMQRHEPGQHPKQRRFPGAVAAGEQAPPRRLGHRDRHRPGPGTGRGDTRPIGDGRRAAQRLREGKCPRVYGRASATVEPRPMVHQPPTDPLLGSVVLRRTAAAIGRTAHHGGRPHPPLRGVSALGHRDLHRAAAGHGSGSSSPASSTSRRRRPPRDDQPVLDHDHHDTPRRRTAPAAGDAVAQIRIPKIGARQHRGQRRRPRTTSGRVPATIPRRRCRARQGNAAIAGHRTTYGAPFGNLDQLSSGDEIILRTAAGILHVPRLQPARRGPERSRGPRPRSQSSRDDHADDLQPQVLGGAAAGRASFAGLADRSRSLRRPDSGRPQRSRRPACSRATPARWLPAFITGLIALLVGGLWWLAYHRHPRWTAWLVGAIPFLVALYFFYSYLERLLPANY